MESFDSQFAQSFIHTPHTILGVRLKPFSLRHYFALTLLDNAFLSSRSVSWYDLEQAVCLCNLNNPLLYIHDIPRPWRSYLWRSFLKHTFIQESRKFIAYVSDYNAPPEVAKQLEGKEATTPWILRIIETLKGNGSTNEEAWSMPMGEAFWRYLTILEINGVDTNILTETEKELIELMDNEKKEENSWA